MGTYPLRPVEIRKTYQRIIEEFINSVVNGQFEYGSRLYNEAELMKILNVSRATLREALRVMEFMGIVTVSPRKGIIVNDPKETNGYLPLVYILMFEKISSVELFEIRRALQVELVAAAAERRSEENLRLLMKIHERLIQSEKADYTQFAAADYDFHMQIVYCAENRLGIKLMQTMGIMLREQLQNGVKNYPEEKRVLIIQAHAAIAKAIAEQDKNGARRYMTEHLERPYQTIRQSTPYYFSNARLDIGAITRQEELADSELSD